MAIFKKLSWFFKQEKKQYGIGITLLVLVALLQVANPWMMGKLIDEIADQSITMNSMVFWLSLMLGSAVGQYVFRYLWRVNIFGTSVKLEKILRERLFHHFTQMDTVFFHQHRTGDLMAHATNDLNAVRQVAAAGILTFADSLTTGGLTLISMAVVVDWKLTLLVVLPLPLLILVSRILGTRMHAQFKQAQKAFSTLNNKTQESISGVKVIKTFGEEEKDVEHFKTITKEVVDANKKVFKIDALFNPAINLILGITFALTIIFGGNFVVTGVISIGQLVSFISYIGMMTWPMLAVGSLFNVLERGSASYDRIEQLLSQESSIYEADHPVDQALTGDLTVSIHSFTYPGATIPVVEDLSFTLKQGETLGIVGKTGSGKSTIFKLLLREYDNYQGSIVYNNIAVKDYMLDTYLKGIGYVPQDNFLFSTTISENIRFANLDYSMEEVHSVAKMTAIHSDILDFPQGYETLVGERGVSLSGGQKQRISIARALITRPELLIMDDSLSAVDAKTEEKILSNLKEFRSGKTTIISAHRISSVMHANEIIVMDQGRIVERGNHQELLSLNGWYKEMYDKQQLELKLDGEGID